MIYMMLIILLINIITRGSWNNIPKPNKYLVTKEKYSLVDISDLTSLDPNLDRKIRALGRLTKYAKEIPRSIKTQEDVKRIIVEFFAFSGNAGWTKRRSWNIKNGIKIRKPKNIEIEIVKLNPPEGEE